MLVDCHTPATSRKKDATIEETRPRGPTGLSDGVRCVLAMHRPKRNGPTEFAVVKSNRGRDDLPVLHLERGDDGVLRCVGEAPNDDERREEAAQKKLDRHAQDLEQRKERVMATLQRLYGERGIPQSRETVAVGAGGTTAKNRTAFDECVAFGLAHRVGGTAARPTFAPGSRPVTSTQEVGDPPPHPPT